MRQRGVELRVIGRRDRLARVVLREIAKAEETTAGGGCLELAVAVDYSSRDAITLAAAEAARSLAGPDAPTLETLRAMLAESLRLQGGEVDLLVRTGGEKRLSDFLLWESAYAELVFLDCMWPDFADADLDWALGEFYRRERRFGGVTPAEKQISPLRFASVEMTK